MLAVSGGVTIPVEDYGPEVTLLPIPFLTQQPYGQLCWAACCAMVLTANDPSKPTDAAHVAVQLLNELVDEPEDPGWVLTQVGLNPSSSNGATDAASLAAHVQARRPIEVWWNYTDGRTGGHVALIAGYAADSQTFCLYDPNGMQAGWVTWDYISRYGGVAKWVMTFYDIGRVL